jgi:ankyrin repeat protein
LLSSLLAENVKEPSYLDIMSSTGFNALIIAAAHGHAKAVEFFDAGADANLVHENGVSALMYSAAANHVEVVKVLIEKGKIDIDFSHTNGTALLKLRLVVRLKL